jgi:pyruvate dehydrogenase E1 component alpha subunit
MLMVLNTYRWMGHSKSDAQLYRTKDEVNKWKEKCPIKRHREYLIEQKILSESEIKALEAQAEEDIKKAVEFAENSPEPKIENIFDDVYED